jgi:anti-sigma regulatory factor (Ser/Thr protein kinase)
MIAGPVPSRELLIVRPAVVTSPRAVRQQLREWLASWSWPADDQADIVAAVDEAVANVVDHAYRPQSRAGEVQVHAWVTTLAGLHRVVVSIIDRGRWRPAPADPGHRGRGLLMMSACMPALHIEHTAGGTAVTMTSAPVPAFDAPR